MLREQLKGEFRAARAAIFPSYSEAFGMAPMEAMSEHCPVIYTKRSSGPELISHGIDGLLIDPDDHAGIADSLIRLLRDDTLAETLGEAGYQRVKSCFSIQTLVPHNETFFQGAIQTFSGRRHT